MTTPDAARARNERLLREYLDRELLLGRDVLEDRLRHLFPGLLGRVVNPIAKALYHAIGEAEVRKRVHEQLRIVEAASIEAGSLGLEAAAAKWTRASLETEEVIHRGNRSHPRFPDVEALLAEAFRERVRAIAPLLAHEGAVRSYEELIRAVYPDRATPAAVIARQIALLREVTRIARANPSLLRFPRPLVGHLFPVVEDVTTWYERRAGEEIERMYGPLAG